MSSPVEFVPAAETAAAEPCPTPLEWRVVVQELRRQRHPFETSAANGEAVRGTTFGSGLPLYIIGPAAGDSELFALLAWLLKDEFCCVLVEPVRIGWPVRPGLELARHSAAIVAAAAHLGHERIALLGVGFGSATALDVGLCRPDLVTAIALVQGAARRSATWFERGLSQYGACLPGTIGSIPGWRGVQARNHRPWFPPFDATRFDFLLQNLGRTPTAQVSRRMLLWGSLDFRPQLRDIAAPVLLIETEGLGRSAAAAVRELHDGLPHAQLESLHSAGFYPYLTHPHRLAKLLRSFLEHGGSQSDQLQAELQTPEVPAAS